MRSALLVAMLLLAACRPSAGEGGSDAGATRNVCTTVGQRCEVSPGKLGSCVRRDDCAAGDCFVCQSQHLRGGAPGHRRGPCHELHDSIAQPALRSAHAGLFSAKRSAPSCVS